MNVGKIPHYDKLGYLRADKRLWFWNIIFLGRALIYNFTPSLFIYLFIYLFILYLLTLSLVHRVPISHETEEYFINHELVRMWKEASVA